MVSAYSLRYPDISSGKFFTGIKLTYEIVISKKHWVFFTASDESAITEILLIDYSEQ